MSASDVHLKLSSSHDLQNFSVLNSLQVTDLCKEISVNRGWMEAPHNAVRCGDPPFYE